MTGRKNHAQDRLPNTLSACLIVKNEEQHLADCLKSVSEFASEIVVVDTGSADNTVKIAESFGAKVVHSDWRNDFSYSRNISLDQATGRWILWLDADDRVPCREAEKIRKLKSMPPDRAFFLIIRNVRRGGFGEQWFQLRMFPNHPAIRFERKIHEQVLPSLLRLKIPTKRVNVRIDHIGYEDPKIQEDKARRNLEILLADLVNQQEDPLYLSAIANSYFVMEEFAEAMKWYKKILETPNGRRKNPDLHRQASTSIALCLKGLGDLPAAWEWIEKSLADNAWKLDSLFIGAELKEKMADPSGASELYNRIRQAPPLFSSCPVDSDGIRAKSLLSLGRIYSQSGRYDEAERAYRECTKKYPVVGAAFKKLGELLSQKGNFQEAVEIFKRAIERRPHDPQAYVGLAKSLVSAGKIQEAAGLLEAMKSRFTPAPNAEKGKSVTKQG